MNKKIKKEAIEWIILLTVMGLLYFTGLHTEVLGKIQQAVLYTGLIQPDKPTTLKTADYHFTLEDFHGNEFLFEDKNGEVVFLNFWATWCPPCIAEMPDIHELYQSSKETVSFVLISIDKDEQKARDYIDKKGFEFPVYFLRSSLPKTYEVSSIPTTYILGKDGQIHIENHGMAKYNTPKIKQLLTSLSVME